MKKEALELLKDKKGLKDAGYFLIDTEKILGEAIAEGFEIKYFFYSEKGGWIFDKYESRISSQTKDFVKESYIDRFAAVKTHQGFIAVARPINREIKDFAAVDRLVVLDNLQDPSNVGAIIRSGAAFGFKDFILINCAGIYSEKTIRASAGAAFKVNYKQMEIKDIKPLKDSFKLVATDVREGTDIAEVKGTLKSKFALILSNEGQGISPALEAIADLRVKINYPEKAVESLNVAAAAAIAFYELSK